MLSWLVIRATFLVLRVVDADKRIIIYLTANGLSPGGGGYNARTYVNVK